MAIDRQGEAYLAAGMLGAHLHLEDLPETQIGAAEPTAGIIADIIREVQPTIIYVHSERDTHQDHRAVHQATMAVAGAVRTVSCYQSASATVDFRPNRFVRIDAWLDQKVQLVQAHASQLAVSRYHQPEFIEATARYWARFGDGAAAEPLEIVRDSEDIQGTADAVQAFRSRRSSPALPSGG